ncbi:CD209 antigen-like protein E [Protopterus annectens]|uniref:CD209 antigen-like protein E n=1 Tax=Protopterus annectens TaxID=7888 RepID=UPI001CFB1A88|nr:CD209 antigen-like protein E [Protopterus annectens]
MTEETVYADIKFRQSAAGKQSSKPEGSKESGTAKEEASAKKDETIVTETAPQKLESSTTNRILFFLCFLCILFLSLAIAATLLYIQEKHTYDECQMKIETLERNIAVLSNTTNQLRNAFCKSSNGTQCSLFPWGTSNFSGWTTYFGNSIYFFSNQTLNWSDSRNACLSMKADLVVINSEAEQIFLKNSSVINNKPFWIGFTDQKEEGKWCWVDDPACNTTGARFWYQNNPDNHDNNENCATENYNEGTWSTWNDDNCQRSYSWICEKSIIPVFL